MIWQKWICYTHRKLKARIRGINQVNKFNQKSWLRPCIDWMLSSEKKQKIILRKNFEADERYSFQKTKVNVRIVAHIKSRNY